MEFDFVNWRREKKKLMLFCILSTPYSNFIFFLNYFFCLKVRLALINYSFTFTDLSILYAVCSHKNKLNSNFHSGKKIFALIVNFSFFSFRLLSFRSILRSVFASYRILILESRKLLPSLVTRT